MDIGEKLLKAIFEHFWKYCNQNIYLCFIHFGELNYVHFFPKDDVCGFVAKQSPFTYGSKKSISGLSDFLEIHQYYSHPLSI